MYSAHTCRKFVLGLSWVRLGCEYPGCCRTDRLRRIRDERMAVEAPHLCGLWDISLGGVYSLFCVEYVEQELPKREWRDALWRDVSSGVWGGDEQLFG